VTKGKSRISLASQQPPYESCLCKTVNSKKKKKKKKNNSRENEDSHSRGSQGGHMAQGTVTEGEELALPKWQRSTSTGEGPEGPTSARSINLPLRQARAAPSSGTAHPKSTSLKGGRGLLTPRVELSRDESDSVNDRVLPHEKRARLNRPVQERRGPVNGGNPQTPPNQ
jgi:hypothetical protein